MKIDREMRETFESGFFYAETPHDHKFSKTIQFHQQLTIIKDYQKLKQTFADRVRRKQFLRD